MKSLFPTLRLALPTAVLAVGAALLLPTSLRAADHGDAPALANDQGADIADVYAFLDPTDTSRVVLIGTVHGFIVPGEAGNFANFDPNVRYRFEIYNKHMNATIPIDPGSGGTAQEKIAFLKAKAAYLKQITVNRTIDVTFSKRVVAVTDPPDAKFNLVKPGPQSATITLGGFTGANHHGVFKQTNDPTPSDIITTPVTLGATAPNQIVNNIGFNGTASNDIFFFAGEVDDPFFFDLVGFSRTVAALHDGATVPTAAMNLSRGRDTFAGYDVLAIALSIPKALLIDSTLPNGGKFIGVDFLTQRHTVQMPGSDGFKGTGAFRTVDRMGNPAVNVALIPFNRKNEYNASTVKKDAELTFAGDIIATISQLGLGTSDASINALAGIAFYSGDVLRLDTTSTAGFPNGRKLDDDVIDTILTKLNNDNTLGDGVSANDVSFQANFPFLAVPHQPQDTGVLDDGTRN
jgi:hypothetical protein